MQICITLAISCRSQSAELFEPIEHKYTHTDRDECDYGYDDDMKHEHDSIEQH